MMDYSLFIITCKALSKNLRAVSCSFCKEKKLPKTHQTSGQKRSMVITYNQLVLYNYFNKGIHI